MSHVSRLDYVIYHVTLNKGWHIIYVIKQDWPVASELVPGGMHFPFLFTTRTIWSSDPTKGPTGESVEQDFE